MRLKHLEMQGFKTFATKTEFVFPTGITAVVGPNGSGKCLDGHTLVTLADGRELPIREVVDDALRDTTALETLDDGVIAHDNPTQLQVLSLNPHTLRLEPRAIAAFVKRQAPPHLLRICTRAGREVTVTRYHPFFTLDQGQLRALRADEVQVGVCLALPRRLPVLSQPVSLDPHDVIAHFDAADNVYIPSTAALKDWASARRAAFGSYLAWAQTAGASPVALEGLREGQAINAAVLAQLSGVAEFPPPLDGQLKSRGTGYIQLPWTFTPDLARFLGLLIAEGRSTSANQVWFVNSDPAINAEFERLAGTLFGVKVSRQHYKSTVEDSLIYSRPLQMALERLFKFPIRSKSAGKEIPPQVLLAPPEVQWAFLSGLFEGDAYLCVNEYADRRQAYIEYTTASRTLAQQVISVLLRLGVFATLRTKRKYASNTTAKQTRSYYSVFIYGVQQLRYTAEHLSFSGEKQAALDQLRRLTAAPNPNHDLIPGVTPLVKTAVQLAGVKLKPVRRAHAKLAAYVEQRCEASRTGLLEVAAQIDQLGSQPQQAHAYLERFITLATSDVYWDEIVSVESITPSDEWVYDLCVAETHNFVAGNIIVHNSNVADGLRWVLGEQVFSALRAKKTEDLIFAGGDGRPRAGMAEVYLTLDNSDGFFPIDFNEVVVGRRAYRDGENEYLLNGSKVRLRDVSELLAKTGLARRTYTVIGQGMVDQALAINSDERRALFEEAAGISLYRHKREDALKKLDETRRNLERVRDILAEIGPRVRSMERQAQRARDYARLSGELQETERIWFGYHWGKGQTALREAKEGVEAQTLVLNARRAELGSYNDRIETIRKQQFELRTQVGEWHRASSGLHTQAEALQRQLAVLEERARSLQQQIDQTQSDQAALETQLIAQAERVAAAEAELKAIVTRYDTQAAAIATAQAALTERQTQRKSLQQSRAEAQTAIQKAELALEDRRNRRTQLAERRAALEQEVTAHAAEIATLQQRQTEFETQRATLEAELAANEAQRAARLTQIETLNNELDRAKQVAAQCDTALDEARAAENRLRERHAILSEMRAALGGFDAGTRAVMGAQLPGVRGLLATLIDVDSEWERAIEAALGQDVQAIVVDSVSIVPEVRDVLGDSDGRVSLLPVEARLKPPVDEAPLDLPSNARGCLPFGAWLHRRENHSDTHPPIASQLPDGLKFATDVIQCADDLRPALEALLKHVVLVDSLSDAEDLWAQLPAGYRLATRSGEVLHTTGLITLGRAAGSGEFLAREREWRELPARIDAATQRSAGALQQQAEALQHIDDFTQQLTTVKDEVRSVDKAIGTKTDERRALERQIEDVQRASDWQQGLIAQAQTEIAVLGDQAAQLQAEEERLHGEIARHTTTLQQSEAQLNELPLETLATQLTAVQAEAAVSDQLRRSQTNVVESYRSGLEQMRGQLQSRHDRTSQIAQERETIGAQINDLRQRETTLHDELAQFTTRIDPAEVQLRTLEIDQNRLEGEERSARSRLSELELLYNQAMLDMARREEELNHLRTRIDEELGLVQLEMADLSGPQPLPLAPIVSELPIVESLPEGMEQELQRMKAQIRRLGPVNPEAQTEYEETKQRFEFLTQQSADLEQAIEQLNQVILELDQLMETSFRETFQKIAEEFKGMFQKLFAGGSAKLVLTEPENIAATGVEIMARPPGKKQQGLALLSGGERSLTAAALMFAILKVKPPPFCILDETDAALDEANVGRFRDTIKELSRDTQFVIITHNRGTIEAADTIYGISMGTDSASRAISLELETAQNGR